MRLIKNSLLICAIICGHGTSNVTADTIVSGDLVIRDSGRLYFPDGSYQNTAQTIGPKGDTGAIGQTGPANSLIIGNVITGDPGTAASANITGVAPNQTLDLLIPQGATGQITLDTMCAAIRTAYIRVPAYCISNGLLALYPLNGDFLDYSVNARNAYGSNATPSQDRFGLQNQAFMLSGINSFIETAINENLPLGSSARTLSIWVNPTKNTTDDQTLFGYGVPDVNNTSCYLNIYNGRFRFVAWGDDLKGSIPPSLNVWQHLVVTYNGSTAIMYLNGAEIGRAAMKLNTSNSVISIGRYPILNKAYFTGLIDDVRLYNRALSIDEILSLYGEKAFI